MITFKQFLEDSKGSQDGLFGQLPVNGNPQSLTGTRKPSDGPPGGGKSDCHSGKTGGGGAPGGGMPGGMPGGPANFMKKMKKQ